MILIFAGAGASRAIDKDNYPTTVEFYDRLPEEINNTIDAIPNLRTFLKSEARSTPMDIEKALHYIGLSRRTFGEFTKAIN